MKYLDSNGLAHLWAKIKALVPPLAEKAVAIPFGEVDASSTSTAYTATIDGITELKNGVCMMLRNGDVASKAGFTFNINGLGAKPVYQSMSGARVETVFAVAFTGFFVFNEDRVEGGCWDLYYGYYTNTNTIGYQVRTNSSSLPVSNQTGRYRICFTGVGGGTFVPPNGSSSTSANAKKTPIVTPFDPFGKIIYYGYTTVVQMGSRLSATYLWEQNVCNIGYSFNVTGTAPTLTSWKPVFAKATPQADGSAILDPDEPCTQELPTEEDGFIYIRLGIAYNATNIELDLNHPVYCYKNGAVRQWTNAVV